MGIPRFFKFINEKYPDIIYHTSFNQGFNSNIDNLYLDANGIIHLFKTPQKDGKPGMPRLAKRKTTPKPIPTGKDWELIMFQNITKYIDSLLKYVKPKKLLYIAIDGPAPIAKQQQQRQRRFKSYLENKESHFDGASITPGTLFMKNLNEYFEYFIRLKLQTDPEWKKIQVIFNNSNVCGEGEHKCFSPDTKVIMWDSTIREIKDIKIGDHVIGDDGLPRMVESIVSGKEQMFLIEQNNGNSYTVTKDHIMCFDVADHCRVYYSTKDKAWILGYFDKFTLTYKRKHFSGDITEAKKKCDDFVDTIDKDSKIDIKLCDYLKMSKRTQGLMYCYKCIGIQWPEQYIFIDPYILGTWLGDGTSANTSFASIDKEIIDAWTSYCTIVNCKIKQSACEPILYHISGIINNKNYIRKSLKMYNLINNKHIPKEYLLNSRSVRLSLLAGLIDTDGNLTHNGRMIRFSQGMPNYKLFDDVVVLVRSLGFKCCIREYKTTYTYKGEKKHSIAKNLTISGNIEDIPTKVHRKKCIPLDAQININRLRTKFKITPVGKQQYIGINITGNKRFLLEDCTVVHNCSNYIRSLKNKDSLTHCMYGLDADLFMLSLSTHAPKFYLLREDIYTTSFTDSFFYKVDIGALAQNLNNEWGPDVVDDFLFVCFLVGNDFLHCLQAFHDLGWSIEFLMNMKKEVLGDEMLVSLDTVNINNFLKLLEAVEPFEADFIAEQFYINSHVNKTLNSSLLSPGNPRLGINLEKYSDEYYKKAGIADVNLVPAGGLDNMCEQYIIGLKWVNYYYHNTPINWLWSYKYHYTPLIKDLVKFLNSSPLIPDEHLNELNPLSPVEQLVCVLPSKGFYLLPPPLKNFYKEFEEYYPSKFDIDLEGKQNDWEGICLLPFIDLNKILPRVNELYPSKKTAPKVKSYKISNKGPFTDYKSKFGNIKNNSVSVTFF